MIETKPFRRRIKDGQNRIAMVNGGDIKVVPSKLPEIKGRLLLKNLQNK
jgi:hypothetical protein